MEILLTSRIEGDRNFGRDVASSAGMKLTVAADVNEVVRRIASESEPFLLLFGIGDSAQAQEFHEKIGPYIGTGSGKIHPDLVHMIGVLSPEEANEFFKKSPFGSFLIRNQVECEESALHYGRMIPEMLAKRGIPGVKRLATDETATLVMTHSSRKQEILDQVAHFLEHRAGFQERMTSTVCSAVDELLMNAIYDAPIDPDGQQKFKTLPRTTPMVLEGDNEIEVILSRSGEYASVSVIDNFGSLKRANIIKHVLKTYQTGEYRVDESICNGGIGLATTFQMGGSLLFFCDANQRTEAMVLFRRTENYKKFKTQFRFVWVQADR